MAAQKNELLPQQRAQLTAKMIANPEENRSQLAQDHHISRPTLYSIFHTGQRALQGAFKPPQPPNGPSEKGFWIWVDANAIKRLTVLLRAACGATLSVIALILAEAFRVQISEETIRQVTQESYQRAFQYRNNVDLSRIKRATFDEMYRWDRCVLTGVDADSLFIFLCEKQRGPSKEVWQEVMARLRDNQNLHPDQSASDGKGSLSSSAAAVWEGVRIAHDINHLRRSIEKVRSQFEQRAYKAIAVVEKMKTRYKKGPTRQTSQEKLEALMDAAKLEEKRAVEKSERISRWVQQAHEALNVIHPKTERINEVSWSQSVLQGLARKFEKLGTYYANDASRYLRGMGQKIVSERGEFVRVMEDLAQRHQVPFEAVEKAAYLWELNKQYQAATWSGTREKLKATSQRVWQELQLQVKEKASSLLAALCLAFRAVLAASSPVEWCHSQIGAVLPPQKRASSGWLGLRTAFLNLTPFREGMRKGQSSHELLTGEIVEDWLSKLGYAPRQEESRRFKKLGWQRLVEPLKPAWRDNWVSSKEADSSAELEEVLEESA